MKKLALALVCLISVAFFASCTPEGQPTISVIPGEEYVHDGDTINVNEDFNIGFKMSSSLETSSELASLTLVIDDETYETVSLEGTEYTYERTLALNSEDEELVITATVTDVLGQSASVTMTLFVNGIPDTPQTEELVAEGFEWNRHGGAAATGNLAELGLAWNTNAKDEVFAVITPVEGADLYEIPAEKWAEVTTNAEKAALFGEGGVATPVRNYTGVSAFASGTYNDVIATLYNGEYHLIHITEGIVSTFKGTDVTIRGEFK